MALDWVEVAVGVTGTLVEEEELIVLVPMVILPTPDIPPVAVWLLPLGEQSEASILIVST